MSGYVCVCVCLSVCLCACMFVCVRILNDVYFVKLAFQKTRNIYSSGAKAIIPPIPICMDWCISLLVEYFCNSAEEIAFIFHFLHHANLLLVKFFKFARKKKRKRFDHNLVWNDVNQYTWYLWRRKKKTY